MINAFREFKAWFSNALWREVFDLIQFAYQNDNTIRRNIFKIHCNKVLEREVSGYRFIGDLIAPITNELEIKAIEEVIDSNPVLGVREHFRIARSRFADREDPDYRNSIKESISAVEAICKVIAGNEKATLSQALKVVKRKIGLNDDLKEGFKWIYKYTNKTDGIRHALMDEPNLPSENARYFLVSCSAFANYLTEKAQKAGVNL